MEKNILLRKVTQNFLGSSSGPQNVKKRANQSNPAVSSKQLQVTRSRDKGKDVAVLPLNPIILKRKLTLQIGPKEVAKKPIQTPKIMSKPITTELTHDIEST